MAELKKFKENIILNIDLSKNEPQLLHMEYVLYDENELYGANFALVGKFNLRKGKKGIIEDIELELITDFDPDLNKNLFVSFDADPTFDYSFNDRDDWILKVCLKVDSTRPKHRIKGPFNVNEMPFGDVFIPPIKGDHKNEYGMIASGEICRFQFVNSGQPTLSI